MGRLGRWSSLASDSRLSLTGDMSTCYMWIHHNPVQKSSMSSWFSAKMLGNDLDKKSLSNHATALICSPRRARLQFHPPKPGSL